MALQRLLGLCSALLLLAIMLMTFVDVTGRYLFGRPLSASYELTQVGLALLIFMALPLVTARSEHVAVDFAARLLSRRGTCVLQSAIQLIGFVAFCGVAAAMAQQARSMEADGLRTEVLALPLDLPVFAMAVCSLLTGFFFLARAWYLLKGSAEGPAGD